MKLLKEYFDAKKQVHDYFGYVEDWVSIPLDDATDYIWHLSGEGHGGEVKYAVNMEDFATGNYYANEIYTQRFLPKWVYRGPEYTMVCVDTRTDGNKFLQIFDNSKELKDDPEAEA
jgi:hypothetical protein